MKKILFTVFAVACFAFASCESEPADSGADVNKTRNEVTEDNHQPSNDETVAHSADEHKHGSPHGGSVKTAGDFHIEVLQKGKALHFYLLDGKEEIVKTGVVSASATVQTESSITETSLRKEGDYYAMHVENVTKDLSIIVTFKIGDKTATAQFGHDDIPHSHGEPHSH